MPTSVARPILKALGAHLLDALIARCKLVVGARPDPLALLGVPHHEDLPIIDLALCRGANLQDLLQGLLVPLLVGKLNQKVGKPPR